MNIVKKIPLFLIGATTCMWVYLWYVFSHSGNTAATYCSIGAFLNAVMAFIGHSRSPERPKKIERIAYLKWSFLSDDTIQGLSQQLKDTILENQDGTLISVSHSIAQLNDGGIVYSALVLHRVFKDDTHQAMGDQILSTVKPSEEDGGIA